MEIRNNTFFIVNSMIWHEVNQNRQKNQAHFWFSSPTQFDWGFKSFGIWGYAL